MKRLEKLLILIHVIAPMACFGITLPQSIVIGNSPNNEDGDPPRTAYQKIMTNENALASGGGGGGGTGIQTNGGSGVKNSLTNLVLATSGNQLANIVGTNDAVNGLNGPTNADLEWTGVGPGNNPELLFVGPQGWYGDIIMQPAHDGPQGSPATSELTFLAANNITFIPNDQLGGDSGHFQFGGMGISQWGYWNLGSNIALVNASPSMPLYWRTTGTSNGTPREFDPGIAANWPLTNRAQGDFLFMYDSGTFGNVHTMPDINTAIIGMDMSITTLGSTFNATNTLKGFNNGSVASSLSVGGSITVNGNVNDANAASDNWNVGNLFNTTDGNFSYNGAGNFLNIWNNDNLGVLYVLDGTGNTGLGHSYFATGHGVNGALFPLGGVTMGTNGNPPAGIELFVAGTLWLQTNAARLLTVSNTTSPVPGHYFTNNTSQRVTVDMVVGYTFSVAVGGGVGSGWEGAYVTNIDGTTFQEVSSNALQSASGYTNTFQTTFNFPLGPGDYFFFNGATTGTGGQSGLFQFPLVWRNTL